MRLSPNRFLFEDSFPHAPMRRSGLVVRNLIYGAKLQLRDRG